MKDSKIKEEEKKTELKASSVNSKKDNEMENYFILLLVLTIIGTVVLLLKGNQFINQLRALNPSYPFPKLKDLFPCLYLSVAMFAFHAIAESALMHIVDKIIDRKYLEPEQAEAKKIISKKLTRNLIKVVHYSFITVFSFYVLYPLDYFPKEFGGKGYMSKMFEKGYPNSFYHEKTKYFDMHYYLCFSYTIVDFIFLVFIYDKQTDFINMIFHHTCTSSLILFSFLTNYSNIGSLVLFLHNASDVVVYSSRSILYLYTPGKVKKVTSVVLLITFVYMRLFGLGKVIYVIYRYIDWDWDLITFSLWAFLIFLYVLHANWTYLILKAFYDACFKGQYNDSCKFEKLKETEKENEKKEI